MNEESFLLGRCENCEQFVYNEEFKNDSDALKKFGVSGLCINCQKKGRKEEDKELG